MSRIHNTALRTIYLFGTEVSK
jgi:hypothetical protein